MAIPATISGYVDQEQNIKVILIQPSEPFGAMAYLPISLVVIAAMLQEAGISVEIIDARIDNLSVSETMQLLKTKKFDVLGITGFTHCYRYIKNLCFECKRVFPEIPIMAGGTFVFSEYEKILRRTPIDVACVGEGEDIIAELVRRLVRREHLHGIPNIAWLDREQLVTAEIRHVEDLDRLPFPAYNVLDMKRYTQDKVIFYSDKLYFPITTGRGCRYQCYFCGRYGKAGSVRRPTPERLMAHMDFLSTTYGIEAFLFAEDSAFTPREFMISFAELYNRLGKTYKLVMGGCPDQLDDDELVKAISSMDIEELNVAVEHWNPAIQKGFYRTKHSSHIFQALALINKYGMQSHNFNILWGHPADTAKSFHESYCKSIDVVQKYGIGMFSYATLVVFPNTALAADAIKAGKILDLEDYMYALGGYGPFVNLTSEDDDNYRGVMVKLVLMQNIDLLLAKMRFVILNNHISFDSTFLEQAGESLNELNKNLAALHKILLLPFHEREPYRELLEWLLQARMYEPNRNYYRDIACFPEILSIPSGSSVAVYSPDSFCGENIGKLFNSIREAGLNLRGFIDMMQTDTVFEGYPVVGLKECGILRSLYMIVPNGRPDRQLVEHIASMAVPGLKIINLSEERFKSTPWHTPGLNGWYENPNLWRITISDNTLQTTFKHEWRGSRGLGKEKSRNSCGEAQ